MVKNHMKRLKAPNTWKIHRKERTFVTMPNPGAHSQTLGLSINTFLKEIVHITKTTKETKYLLTKQEVLVNGKRIRDDKYAVGLFDIISVPSIKKSFRVVIDSTGSLTSKEVKETENLMLQRIIGKSILAKDKVQINFMSGENILVSGKDAKNYKRGDSLVMELPKNKVMKHLARENGVQVFIFIGKHVGKQGVLEEIQTRTAKIKVGKEMIETSVKYIFVTGKDKPEVDVA